MELPVAAEMLSRTPDVLDALLIGLPPQWLHRDEVGPWRRYMPALERTAEAE
jgi:hypothetical protein